MQLASEEQEVLNNRYKLLERVGSGGMASVYKSQDLVLGRLVAVKLLHYGLTGDPAFLAKFRKEAHAVANLAHPNIVTVHDIGQDGDRQNIVMEFVEGQTLKDLIRSQPEGRPMSIQRALDLTIQICSGLGYAHRAGLVHCDMKPQNVLVARDERVKVTDFGIARAISEATAGSGEQVWGTPQYFSPEQARGEGATPASDVYSLGVILFELLTGGLPFSAESHTALALKHIQETAPRAGEINPNTPHQLDEIVAKVMSKEPAQRYRTAGQFGRILSTYRARGFEETGTLNVQRGYTTEFFPRSTRLDDQAAPTGGQTPQRQPTPVRQPTPSRGMTPSQVSAPVQPTPHRQPTPTRTNTPAVAELITEEPEDLSSEFGFDWVAVALGLIALVAVLGLIPLWYSVYVRVLP